MKKALLFFSLSAALMACEAPTKTTRTTTEKTATERPGERMMEREQPSDASQKERTSTTTTTRESNY